MRTAILVLFLLIGFSCFGEAIKIGLFHHEKVSSFNTVISIGEYDVFKNDELVHSFKAGDRLSVTYSDNSVLLNSTEYNCNASTKIDLVAKSGACRIKISPKTKPITREITGNLSFWNKGNGITVINTLDLNVYISGVIEAEAGTKQNTEYYKVQAVICRTYALSNKFKHAKNGFHLCDDVHCQVYKGVSKGNPDIIKATIETSDVVVVDQDINLITTAFHSNCGGQTVNSENVWSKAVPYLKAVPDSFCLDMPHSKWKKEVKKVHWMGFLKENKLSHKHDSLTTCSFETRQTEFYPGIELTDIRWEFGLMSTLFSVTEQNETMLFTGKGFGHGVGLCQEGAMKMSQLGYSFSEILHYYFTDIHVVPLSNFHLFRED